MSLYEDEDLGGPPAVSSWSRGKCDMLFVLIIVGKMNIFLI